MGWAATIVGQGLWTRLLQRYPANRVAPFSLAVPVVGLTAGMLVLDEGVTQWQWAGITLVVAALACVVLGPRFLRPNWPLSLDGQALTAIKTIATPGAGGVPGAPPSPPRAPAAPRA